MWKYLFGKKTPVVTTKSKSPPRVVTNANRMRNRLLSQWPSGAGGYAGTYRSTKTYGKVGGIPLKINYDPKKKGQLNIVHNISKLEPGETYLYVIQITRSTGKFSTLFKKTEGRIEFNARHSFLANLSNPREKVVAAAGEIKVFPDGRIKFNLESGTFMYPGMRNWYLHRVHKLENVPNANKNKIFEKDYPNFVRGVLGIPQANYTRNVLINQRTVSPRTVIRRANETPGVEIYSYKPRSGSGLPRLSYKNWLEHSARRTRSKGPVHPNMKINKSRRYSPYD